MKNEYGARLHQVHARGVEEGYVTRRKPTTIYGVPFRWESLPLGVRFYVTTEGWEEDA